MMKFVVLTTTALLLGGCALPVPLQIASWALDGISVLTTKKSITDHGISLVAEKDCAIWRGIVEGELCRDTADTDVLVAEKTGKPDVNLGFVPATPGPAFNKKSDVLTAGFRKPEDTSKVTATKTEPRIEGPAWDRMKVTRVTANAPSAGIYYVIGSFNNLESASRLSRHYGSLPTSMIFAKFGDRQIYRVVVGPVPAGGEKSVHKDLGQVGLVDIWAMRVMPADWSVAQVLPASGGRPSDEVAKLAE